MEVSLPSRLEGWRCLQVATGGALALRSVWEHDDHGAFIFLTLCANLGLATLYCKLKAK